MFLRDKTFLLPQHPRFPVVGCDAFYCGACLMGLSNYSKSISPTIAAAAAMMRPAVSNQTEKVAQMKDIERQ
jgi:hypothetical protein